VQEGSTWAGGGWGTCWYCWDSGRQAEGQEPWLWKGNWTVKVQFRIFNYFLFNNFLEFFTLKMPFTNLNPTFLLIFSLGKGDCWIIPHIWNIIHTSHKIWLNCEKKSINYRTTFHLVFCIYLFDLTFFA
jgi:hypothetical protein